MQNFLLLKGGGVTIHGSGSVWIDFDTYAGREGFETTLEGVEWLLMSLRALTGGGDIEDRLLSPLAVNPSCLEVVAVGVFSVEAALGRFFVFFSTFWVRVSEAFSRACILRISLAVRPLPSTGGSSRSAPPCGVLSRL